MSESAVYQFYTRQSDVSKKNPFFSSCGWHDGNLFANFQIFPELRLPQAAQFFPVFFSSCGSRLRQTKKEKKKKSEEIGRHPVARGRSAKTPSPLRA